MVDKINRVICFKDKKIGENYPTFIIAEAGVNHNGEIKLAKKLIDIAVEAGVDAVKFQTGKAEDVVINRVDVAEYVKKNINKSTSQQELIKDLELNYDEFIILKKYCDNKGILFLSTPHSIDAINFLKNLVPLYKFGSGDITNIPALKLAATTQKPIMISSGMSDLEEVIRAVEIIRLVGNDNIVILHCTTDYPCKLNDVNLNVLHTLKKETNCLVGYSDHSMGITVPIMAATLGAVVVEKHFTLDKNLPGPDHKASLEPSELKKMVREIRNVELALGSYEKKATNSENKIKNLVRKSIVAKDDIDKGVIIKEDMLDFKRPGSGLSPSNLFMIVGKKTKRSIKKDELILIDMVN